MVLSIAEAGKSFERKGRAGFFYSADSLGREAASNGFTRLSRLAHQAVTEAAQP
jgi:hypothetical protein